MVCNIIFFLYLYLALVGIQISICKSPEVLIQKKNHGTDCFSHALPFNLDNWFVAYIEKQRMCSMLIPSHDYFKIEMQKYISDKNYMRKQQQKTHREIRQKVPNKNDHEQKIVMDHTMMQDDIQVDAQTMRLPYAWSNPTLKSSNPPHLMGKQMGVIETLGIPSLGYEMDGDVKVFRLIVQPVEITVTDESVPADYDVLIPEKNKYKGSMMHHPPVRQKLRAWGYNGITPGPTIEANEGDRIRIVVTNELPEPTSIHWHGIELPNDQDGAAGFAEPPLLPGETKIYEFTLYQSGTYFYHGEFNLMKQSSYGEVGMLIIHPKKYEYSIDKQFAITMQEWRILPGNVDPDLVSMDFNWFTFNGHSAPSIPMMKVKQGDRVRIRLVNMSMDNHPIHMHGHTWWVVGTEGGPIPKSAQWPGNTVDVPPGGSRDVEFVAWNPGMWFFHCHKLHHVMNSHADVPLGLMHHGGMFTIVYVEPKDPDAPWQHPKENFDLKERDSNE